MTSSAQTSAILSTELESAKQGAPCAVLVGLCAHGLTIARSLFSAGVKVVALEANRDLPGVRTKCAEVRFVSDINGPGLVDALIELAQQLGGSERPVLFLTNDRMVETVSRSVHRLRPHFRLSWAGGAERLAPLLQKDRIEERCLQTGLNYPRTLVVSDASQLADVARLLRFPVIVKPTRPVSSFKTIVATTVESLEAERTRIGTALPAVVQEFIEGDDRSIRFGALYLERGKVIARFEGRKLRSRPMGHTTVAVSETDESIHAQALRFFAGLDLSGPVSLELKRDPTGVDWVIEPTVGRTDFWVGLCIANGVDLPRIEYLSETIGTQPVPLQQVRSLWVNGDRDPAAVGWLLLNEPATLFGRRVRGVFASRDDVAPFVAACRRDLQDLPRRALGKALRLFSRSYR